MKRISALLLFLALTLTGCVGSASAPEVLHGKNATYKTGFYGTLFPNHFEPEEETLQIGKISLEKIKHDTFALYHADIGSYAGGTVYCNNSCYDDAVAYYKNPKNYLYYCKIGLDSDTTDAETVEIPEVDTEKFEALLSFIEHSSYDPFDDKKNEKTEKLELPMPERIEEQCMMFYKESRDTLFVSEQANNFYIIDGTLYLTYRYDYGHGEYEKLIAVKAPDEIGAYFIALMQPYLS